MRRHRYAIGVVMASLAMTASGCGGGSSVVGDDSTTGSNGQSLTTLKVGEVPALSSLVLNIGIDQGIFEKHGIDLQISATDAGPAVITSTIQGSYDVGVSAGFPVLVALSQGAPLKAVVQATGVAPNEGNSGLLVKPDSGITGYRDLEGKTVATNALTSLTTLATQVAIDADGGDHTQTKFVALPFAQANQAVEQGQVDGSVVLEPFVQQGLGAGLQLIGDPIGDDIPQGSPYGLLFTSEKTLAAKGDALRDFAEAVAEADSYANDHPDAVTAAAVKDLKLDPKLAADLPIPTFEPTLDDDALAQLSDVMQKYGYLSKPVDLTSFVPAS